MLQQPCNSLSQTNIYERGEGCQILGGQEDVGHEKDQNQKGGGGVEFEKDHKRKRRGPILKRMEKERSMVDVVNNNIIEAHLTFGFEL
jgi:hypothetical protein